MAEGMDPLSVDEQRKQIADRLFQEEAAQEAQQQEFRQRAWDMTQPPPDQAAEALSLGNKFGVPRQAVEADPELWRRKDENARASLMREVSPRTLAWLDNEDNYAVAKDDKDILAEIESTFSKIGYAIKGGAQRFAAGGVAYERQAIGETMDYYRRLDAWEQREERRKKLGQDAPQGWRTVRTPDIGTISGFDLPIYYGNLDAAPGASGIVREQVRKALPATMRPMFMSQVDRYDAKAVRPILERKMAEVDARGRAVTAEFTESLEKARSDNFILNGLTQAMTSITEMAPSMAAFFVLRGRGGATVGSGAMGAQVFGAEYLEGVYNLNLDERAASDRALLQAGVEVVTERISLGVLDDMLKSDKGFLTKLGVSMAAEQIQEQAATLGNRLVDIPYVAPDTTAQQFLADTPEAAANTAITTLFAAGITNTTLLTIDSVARRMVTDSINASESAGDRAIKTLLDKAQKAKTSKRSPEKMAEFIEGLAEQSNLETVVVDLDGVVQALNQAGINPTETLSALGVSQDELQQRYERFGEIEVKTSTLVTSPAMAAHRAAIEPHVRATQDAATPAQKEVLKADFEAALKDGAAQIQDALDTGKTTAEKVTQVRESLKARILGAGMDTQGPQLEAKLDALTALLTTLPQRTGQDVLDFYAAKAPKIQGVMEGEVMAEEGVLGSEAGTPNNDERLAFFESMPDVIESARAHSIKIRGNADNVEADLSNPAFLERQYLEGLKNKRKELNDKAQDANNAGDVDSYNDFADQADAVRAQIVAEEARQKQVTALNRNNPDQSDSADLLGQELPAAEMQTLDAETQEAITDPQTDVLPLTDDMQVMDLDEFVAFHGTLAKFDKFETDKIGAGEGAQAFGPGHYFTQSRGIADWYRKRMKTLSPGIRMGKEPFNKANPAHFAMSEYWRFRNKNLYHSVFGGYKPHTSDSVHWRAIEQAVWALEFEIKQIENPMTYPGGVISDYATPDRPVIRDSKELVAFLKAGIEHLRSLDPESSKGIPRPSKPVLRGGGSIYTVAVKLPAEQTIQYDKPFGQQPAAVQKAFREAAEAGHLGKAGAALAKYGDATRMDVLVAALKNMKSPAMDVMRANGIRGVRYLDGMSRGKKNRAGQSYNYVVFNDGDVKILDREGKLFQKMMDQQRRGQYAPRTNVITLFEQADITTLMHEAAHWYLETLYSMSIEPDAHPFVVEQYEAIRKWGKVGPDFRMYDDMGRLTPEAVELHESFAETFEVYLQTGNAPTSSLRQAFQAFKGWITKLWKQYTQRRPTRDNLNPEIVAVMDRMLAVDEEIDAQVEGIIRSAEQQADELLKRGIITKRQRDAAIMNLEAARESAKEDLMARLMEAKMREDEAWWATERARVRRDVLREFDKSPVGRALSWLGYGQWKGDVPVGEETPGEFDDELYQAYELARPDVDLDQFALSAKQREIAQMILDGAAYADIEEVLGLTRMQLASYIKEARKKGVPLPKQAPIARSAVSKLEPQTDVIIDLFVEGASLAQMGAILNADQSTVGDFVRKLKADGIITDDHIAANEARKGGKKQPQRIQEASVFRDRARGYFKEGDLEFVEFRDDRLTERDSKIVEMARNGASNMDIAEEWGLSVRTVSHVMTKARRLGIDVPYATSAQDAPLMERVLRLEEKGMTNSQIAEIIETTVGNVNDALKRAAERGLYVPIKDRIIDAWNAGKGVASIADDVRRSPAVVRRYLADAGLIQKQDKSSRYMAAPRRYRIASYGGASVLGDESLGQSIRAAARMPMAEVDAWVRANITADESTFPNGDTLTVVRFPLTEDEGAPEVMLSIRMKADGKQAGRADVNLFLDNQMADALEGVEDVAQRGRLAMEMFGKAVLVMRKYAVEYDPRAFSFVAAESQAEGTKAKSREDLYRFMLSSMKMDGYTAYEVESMTSVVNEIDGAKSANPMFPSAGFMLVKDGENVEDFARNEILRGNQRGGGAGEVVTVLQATRLTPDLDASGRRMDRRGSQAVGADTGSTLGQSLPRDLIRPASERNIGAAPALPDKAGMIAALDVQVGFAEALLADNQSADLADVTLRLRRTMEQADSLPRNEFLGAWYANLEALARVADSVSPPVAASVRDALASPLGQRVKAVLDDRGVRILQAEQVGEPPVLLIRARMFDGETLGQSTAPTFYSALGRFASRSGTARAPASQWKGMITNAPGIKAEEVEWTGVMEWLDLQEGPVTREALAAFVEGNGVRVEEVVRGQAGATDEIQRRLLPLIEQREQLNRELDLLAPESEDFVILDDRIASLTAQIRELNIEEYESGKAVRFSAHTLPGGENYREMLLTLPEEISRRGEGPNDPVQRFRSSHWTEPNVLAHVRFKERTGPNGERVLALEEIQSDWHQAGRERGYKENRPPIDRSTWRAEKADSAQDGQWGRWKVFYGSGNDDFGFASARSASEAIERLPEPGAPNAVPNAPFKNNAWTELVLKRMIRYAAENGFDAVAWIPGNIQNGRVVETDDNRGDFYDKIVPNIANKLGKKFGARVTQTPMEMPAQARGTGWEDTGQPRAQIDAGAMSWWTLPLTPELAAAAMTEGFPLFQPGDPKGWGETAPPPDLPPMRLDLARTEEIYGKAAVDALPKAIKDRYRDQTSVDSMLAAARGAAKTLKRKPPKSLFQFIRARKSRAVEGKSVPQKQWGIKGATDELKAMDRADLINEASGIHIDYMRELAEEAGYLPEGSTVNDLLNAIDKEARGEPVYSEQDANEVLEIQSAQQWADWLSENGVDIFEADQRKLKAAIAKVTRTTNADLKDPEEAAELLGFENGEQLLRALAEAGSRERFIDAETDRRMREEFGDPFTTGEFAEAARQAAEAEVKFRAAEIEIEALSRALGETAASKLAKEMAMDALSVMTVKELAGWERFLEIERREMRNAMKAVQAGDISKALTHKRRQLVNGHLAKAAREKSEAIEKTRKDLLTYFTSKGRRDKIARDYLDKIEALLETYELRVSKQGPGVQRARLSAKEYVDQMVADGREAEIAPEAMLLAAQADKKVWRGLTVDEVEYLAGTVKNLAHLGRTKNSLMKAQDKRRFDAVVAELVDVLVAAPSTRKRGKSFSPGIVEEQMSRLSVFDAKLTMIPDEFEWLDGKQGGPLATTLGLPFEQADVRKLTMLRDATKKIRGLWNALPSNIRKATLSKRVSTPELALPTDQNMTLMDVVIIGLNWGNAGNRQALIDGYGWDPAAVEAVLDRNLTDAHWQFIEGVWSLIGSYKDEAFALEKRITGVAPKAVEGITFTLPSGRVVKGAYFPLKYDADQESALSVKQGKLDEKQMLSEMGLSFSKPMTKTGHLISRVGSGGKPVKVSLDVFYEHIENVIHDIAFRPAVIDAFRIIRDPRFTQAYIDAAGKAQYDRLMPWLHAIATNNRARFSSTFARTMTFFRGGWSISMMGYSFSTATQQLTGYIEAATEIGPRWVLQGAMKSLSLGPASFWREWAFIRERSEYLANRVAFGKERDIRAVRTNARPGGTLAPIGDNAFVFLSTMDAIVGTGVWRGAYDKAMAGRVDGIAAKDEEQAIAFADRAVQRSLSSGEVYRLPEIMREGEISALMTMVYSYGAKTYNRQRSRNLRARYGQMGLPAYLTSTLIAFMAVPILAALLAGRLWPDDDEDWEERGDDMANEVLMNAAGTTPFVRDMVSLLARPQYGYQLSPVQSTFEQIGVATRSAAEGKTFDSEYQTKQAVMALATVFRLPGGQLFETGDYVYDLYMGAEDPMADPVDAAREALIRSER